MIRAQRSALDRPGGWALHVPWAGRYRRAGPWSGGTFLTACWLCPRARSYLALAKPMLHKKLTDWARQMVLQLRPLAAAVPAPWW